MRPLLKFAVLDRQRNAYIRNELNVTPLYIRKYEIANLAHDEIWEKIDEYGKTKDNLGFKGTDPRPKP
jgi:hypothetical protein